MISFKAIFPIALAFWPLSSTGFFYGQAAQSSGVVSAPVVSQSKLSPEEQGNLLFAENHYQAAIAAFKQVTPPTASAWNKMGISYQMMYNVNEARKCYEAAHEMDPKNVNYLNNLATAYIGLKEYGNAERAYRKALKINARDALIYKNLGTLYIMQGKLNKGKKAYDEARKLDPKIFVAGNSLTIEEPTSVHGRGAMNYMMARSCVQSGLTECALEYLRASINEGYTTAKKVELDPDFKPLLNVYAFQQMVAELSAKQSQGGGKTPRTGHPE